MNDGGGPDVRRMPSLPATRSAARPQAASGRGNACGIACRIACALVVRLASGGAWADGPEVLDGRYAIEPVTDETQVVTPIGCAHDHRGRLLVIESHTHQRPEGYDGPPHDRIRIVEDTDGDGRADRIRTFHEGTRFTMAIRRGPDDWIYVATRAGVFRLRDADGDGVADDREQLLTLETSGDYPHNGLGGLAFAADGSLHVGLGENLGAPYRLVAADGSSWSGAGEGGSVFRCSPTGTGLARLATGFWNPFGLAFDPVGRLFAVDNDPDARPPCRLIDVVATGDYGYRFRFGRGGRHPLQCWDGELPGTLPMAAGTGEAPCNVVPFDGGLWVTSWGHNRIEVYEPRPHGASCRATGRIVVQGNHQFRPVDASPAADGSLLITDWVDRSYPVHGRGRLWRLRLVAGAPRTSADSWPPLSAGELAARRLAAATDGPAAAAERLAALADADPFLRQAAVAGSIGDGAGEMPRAVPAGAAGLTRLGLLMIRRWRADVGRYGTQAGGNAQPGLDAGIRDETLAAALADADERVVSFAVRWIADERVVALRPALERLLAADTTSTHLLPMLITAIDWLDQEPTDKQPVDREAARRRLQGIWIDPTRPAHLRLAALKMAGDPPGGDGLVALAAIARGAGGAGDSLAREAVRLLAARPTPEAAAVLEQLAADSAIPAARRADALVGLLRLPQSAAAVVRLAADADPLVAATARDLPAGDVTAVAPPSARPAAADLAAWTARLGSGGDADAGWRLFFGSRRARCGDCHAIGGRGAAVGPDLSGIAQRMDRGRVLESILQPSREVGPVFQPCSIELADGRVVTGMSLDSNERNRTERFLTADGSVVTVPLATIERRQPLATSIMPAGLEQGLSDDDLRNLLALLEE